jgi:hypothetical protein
MYQSAVSVACFGYRFVSNPDLVSDLAVIPALHVTIIVCQLLEVNRKLASYPWLGKREDIRDKLLRRLRVVEKTQLRTALELDTTSFQLSTLCTLLMK